MDSRFVCLLALSALAATAVATDVQQCEGMSIENLSERVTLKPCKKIPCKLKKGTRPEITLEFTPDKDIHELINHVQAEVLGIPLPFVGVDGNSVCEKIFLASSPDTPAPCPLKAGTNYVYKDSFPVLSFYPSITTNIHWSLKSSNKDVICFEVGARIANS